jgi:glycosyltransferase involved in cell wall biosynthesis
VRVEIVCASRELFGSDRSAVRLARLLRSLGHEVSLAVPRARPERGLSELAASHGLAVEPAPVLVASRRGLTGIASAMRGGPQSKSGLTIYNSAAVVARRGDRRPRLLVLREFLHPEWRRHRLLSGLHARRLDGVVAISTAVADGWRACAGEGAAVDVCPNWIDEDWLASERHGDREGILFCGRLNQWKGQMALADAFERAFGSPGSAPSLTFVGAEGAASPFHGNAEALRRRCEQHGWRLVDFTPDPRPYFSRAALLVVPSLRPEPFGNVILEGLASGSKVIAFEGGGVDDLAPLFPGAIEVVPRNTGALADALRAWWLGGGEPLSVDEHARVRATLAERFTAKAVAPRWQRIIDGVAAIR